MRQLLLSLALADTRLILLYFSFSSASEHSAYSSHSSAYSHNATNVIARFCRGTIPRTCDRSNINETFARPCTISESYVSSSDTITLELRNTESTVLRWD